MEFVNVYEDTRRAEAYAKLEFPNTYYLAYRDLPDIIREHVAGRHAIDVGCGTGRSTRFLQQLGFETIGVDIAEDMIRKAQERDPHGKYYRVGDGNLSQFHKPGFDLALAVFTFDNIPTFDKKVALFTAMRNVLNREGRIVILVSSPEIYTHEWASFSTKDFPENLAANSGDPVKIVMTDVEDTRPVEDVLWSDEAYHDVFRQSELAVVATHAPLGRDDEPYHWVNETRIAPWAIYVLKTTEEAQIG